MTDRRKLVISIGADVLGMGSYFVPGLGEIGDVPYSVAQAAWIRYAYGNWWLAGFGLSEEILPFVADWIPSSTISHFIWIKKLKKEKR